MKKISKILIITLILSFLISCGSQSGGDSGDNYMMPKEEPAEYTNDTKTEETGTDSTDITLNVDPNRKLIFTYYLSFKTTEYDKSIEKLNELVTKYDGIYSNMSEYTYDSRNIDMIVQIPKDKVSNFVKEVSEIESLGMSDRRLDSLDVTDQYTDSELRLNTLKEKLERLKELQEVQSDLESLIQLESEISDTIFQIERIEGELRSLDSKIDYTDVHISISEKTTYVQTPIRESFSSRISTAFSNSFIDFKYFMEDFIVTVIYLLPYIIILIIVIFIIKKIRKKRKAKGKGFKGFRRRKKDKEIKINTEENKIDNKE